jgi:hypothetical protein
MTVIFGVMAGYSYFAMAFVVARAPGGRWGLRIVGKNGTVEVDHAFGFLEAARFFGLAGLSLLLMCSVPLVSHQNH